MKKQKTEDLSLLTYILKDVKMDWKKFEELSSQAQNFILNGSLKTSQVFLDR